MNQNIIAAIMNGTYHSDQDKYIFTNSVVQEQINMTTTTRSKSKSPGKKGTIEKDSDSPSSKSRSSSKKKQQKTKHKLLPKILPTRKSLHNINLQVCMLMLLI